MWHPQHVYYLAIGLMLIVEVAQVARGSVAFGRMLWVLSAVFLLSFGAHAVIAAVAGVEAAGRALPAVQMVLHPMGFVAGLFLARSTPGHVTAMIFLPMATIDLFHLIGLIGLHNWWWAIFWLACGQLIWLGASSELHSMGRAIRIWAVRNLAKVEMRIVLSPWGLQ